MWPSSALLPSSLALQILRMPIANTCTFIEYQRSRYGKLRSPTLLCAIFYVYIYSWAGITRLQETRKFAFRWKLICACFPLRKLYLRHNLWSFFLGADTYCLNKKDLFKGLEDCDIKGSTSKLNPILAQGKVAHKVPVAMFWVPRFNSSFIPRFHLHALKGTSHTHHSATITPKRSFGLG